MPHDSDFCAPGVPHLSPGELHDVGPLVEDIGDLLPARLWTIYTEWLCGWRVARIAKFYGLSSSVVFRLTRGWEHGTLAHPQNQPRVEEAHSGTRSVGGARNLHADL